MALITDMWRSKEEPIAGV